MVPQTRDPNLQDLHCRRVRLCPTYKMASRTPKGIFKLVIQLYPAVQHIQSGKTLLGQLAYLKYIHLIRTLISYFGYIYPNQSIYSPNQEICLLGFIVQNMVNISGNKIVLKIVGKFFLAKGFFVNMDVYFQNMAIKLRLCKPRCN